MTSSSTNLNTMWCCAAFGFGGGGGDRSQRLTFVHKSGIYQNRDWRAGF